MAVGRIEFMVRWGLLRNRVLVHVSTIPYATVAIQLWRRIIPSPPGVCEVM